MEDEKERVIGYDCMHAGSGMECPEIRGILLSTEEIQAILDFVSNQYVSHDPRPKNKLYDGEILHATFKRMSTFLRSI